MYRLTTKNFIRSKMVLPALLLIILAGVISILTGKQFIDKQDAAIAAVNTAQTETLSRNARYFKDELGLMMYHSRFAIVNNPSRLSAVSIGQRDINPSVLSLTMRGLQAQLYDTDLNNPYNQLSGNLDFGFVIIYFFPLLIIAFTYNLLSEEKEGGTWVLVAVNARKAHYYLYQKMMIRFAVVSGCLSLLWLLAILVLSLPLDASLLAFVALSFLYIVFWFAICLLVISCKKNSNYNALVLLTVWIFLAVLSPATVNNLIVNKYPVPEALGTMLKQRDSYHEKFDMDKKATVEKFYSHYPQFSTYSLPDRPFSYLWYYAMQQAGDDESAGDAREMRNKLNDRERTSRLVALLIPTMNTQMQFNDLARGSLSDHLLFQDSVSKFHEKLRLHFYPKIFSDEAVAVQDWRSFQPESFSREGSPSPSSFFSIFLITTLVLVRAASKIRSHVL